MSSTTTPEPFRGQRARVARRERVERLLALAEHLPEPDRLLVEHVYRHGRPLSELARVHRRPHRPLQKRLAALLQRMAQPQFQLLADRAGRVPAPTRHVARAVVCHGCGYRQTARRLGVTVHHVRTHMRRFHALADAENATPAPV